MQNKPNLPIRNTIYERKQTQFHHHRTYAHIAQRTTNHGSRVTNKYAKQTQFPKLQEFSIYNRETKICETNPISTKTSLDPHRPTGHRPRVTIYAKRTQFPKLQQSCIENMQNEPNLNRLIHSFTQEFIPARRDSFTHTPINAKRTQFQQTTSDQRLMTINMQNEPNLATSSIRFDPAYGPRVTAHESRFLQNEPNFKTTAPTKHANGANFSINFSSEIHKKCALLLKKSQKIHNFCKLLKLTHLTPCISKTYINIHTGIPFTLHEIRESFLAFQNKVDFIKNCKIIQKYAFGLLDDN